MPIHLTPKKSGLRPVRATSVGIRLTQAEHDLIKEKAASFDMTISDYLRPIILETKMISRTDSKVLAELRRLGGLLKHVHNESKGAYSDKTASAIIELKEYISVIKQGSIKEETNN